MKMENPVNICCLRGFSILGLNISIPVQIQINPD
jgi:hypothetical protein